MVSEHNCFLLLLSSQHFNGVKDSLSEDNFGFRLSTSLTAIGNDLKDRFQHQQRGLSLVLHILVFQILIPHWNHFFFFIATTEPFLPATQQTHLPLLYSCKQLDVQVAFQLFKSASNSSVSKSVVAPIGLTVLLESVSYFRSAQIA
ncbi:Hypothetical predicted protein [Olea europaea subsp. europaea]|uniref:Uncharacterized protein n=1 Tax=Olea europaea subsp. europaea TaxID=158383 RepID=A0A8S0R4D0_OLEEU|nr:Hypothetical predicted protein [Olea europaea subsp. europaea]